MKTRRGAVGIVGLALALFAVPADAHAAFLFRGGSEISYADLDTETNDLVVGFTPGSPGEHTFSDPLNPIDTSFDDPGPGEDPNPNQCVNVTATTASCPALPGDTLIVNLADGTDSFVTTNPTELAVCGGHGQDDLTGGPGPDLMLGEGDSDTIDGGEGNDIVITEAFVCDDTQTAPPATNDVEGGAGNDALIGGKGADTLRGGADDDILFGARINDGVAGDAGDTMSGGEGVDTLVGHDGDDVLEGENGPDTLVGGVGDDDLLGGDGDDRLGVTVNQSFGAQNAPQRVTTTDPGQDLLDGGAGDDLLNGGPGGFILNFGIAGSIDPFETSTPNGPDDLRGGSGRDTVSYVNFALPMSASLDDVANDGSSGEGDNVRSDNEVVVGGSGGDTLVGSPAADTIDGGKGSDSLNGAGGGDSLAGGADDDGRDSVTGGAGSDSANGGPGDDSLNGEGDADTLDGGGGADAVDGGDGADSVSGGAGLDSLAGGPGDDQLRGAAAGAVGADGADSLRGDGGNDDLGGGASDDTLSGGPGADVMAGDEGIDIASYQGAGGPVTARLDGARNDGERGEGDHIRADVEGLRGGREQDTFTGSSRANVLDGGDGEDFLDGAGGADRLSGGGGADTVRSRDRARDRVACGRSTDFAAADSRDRVGRDCERIDRGGRRRPVLGRSMLVRPAGGAGGVRLAGTRRFVPLKDSLLLPLRSSLDATGGSLRVTTRGSLSTGTFSGGRFGVRQRRRRHAPTELRLEGGSFRGCSGRRVVRTLRGRGRGRFSTRGRSSSTATRRASWVVQDRCDGTLTRVRRGRAVVVDPRRKRRATVRAGRSYLARAR